MKDQANPLVNNYLQAISKNGITPFPQAIELLDFVSISLLLPTELELLWRSPFFLLPSEWAFQKWAHRVKYNSNQDKRVNLQQQG